MTIDLLCMGEPMLEFNQQPPRPDGARLYLEGHGGDTSNAAIAAARQGARVGMLAAIGRDMPGDSFVELWSREGVDTSAVIRSDRDPTGVYFVTHDAGGHHFLHYRRGSASAAMGPDGVPEAAVASARMLYLSGITQGISAPACDAAFRAIGIARANGAAVAYDTNYRPRLWPPARAAWMVATRRAPPFSARRQAVLDFYLRLGPPVVVLKMGERGAWFATPDRRVAIPPHPVVAVDATGAGDTFCGSFLARVLAGDGPEDAARYAAVAAALKCQGYGAVAPIPHLAEVMAAMRSASP